MVARYLSEPPPFEIGMVETADTAVVAVSGELDLHTAPKLEAALGSLDGSVVVDLSNVAFLDSTTLSVLLGASSRSPDGSLRIVLPRGEVRRVFEITGLTHRFRIAETLEEALDT